MARRILVRTLSFLLIAVTGAALVGCPLYYGLLMTFFGFPEIDMGDVVITMTMRDVSEPLTYYQDHMADAALGAAEYSWGVQIDTDNDVTTGDAEGFDITFAVKFETGGNTTVTAPLPAPMIDILPDMTVTPPVDHEEEPDTPRLVGLAGNTLYIGASTSEYLLWREWDAEAQEYILVSPTFRAQFFARYNDPPDPATEIVDTVELIGNGTQSDPAEDVSYSFIDIVAVRIDNLPVGAQ